MADLAKTLIRSTARAFYETEHILVVDALFIHSALRDDDLAYLLGMQVKALRKLCGKLREAGLISVQSRQELREGANRPFSRDYFYIDPHLSIDSIKFRISRLTSTVAAKYAPISRTDRIEYTCPRCLAEYTQMEVLDLFGPQGFECRRCGNVLEFKASDASEEAGAGSATQSRLMEQLSGLLDLMAKIDRATVPPQTFEQALAKALPVIRLDGAPDGRGTSLLDEYNATKPLAAQAAVKGQKAQAADKIEISLTTANESAAAAAEAEAQKRERLAKQNALPEWHTKSTLTGEATALGAREAAARREREFNGTPIGPGLRGSTAEDEAKDKKTLVNGDAAGHTSMMDEYFKALREEQQRAERQDLEDEDADEEDEDADTGFEDVPVGTATTGINGVTVNGTTSNGDRATINGHARLKTEVSTPGSSQPASSAVTDTEEGGREAKRARIGEGAPAAKAEGSGSTAVVEGAGAGAPEESEEDDFEDVI